MCWCVSFLSVWKKLIITGHERKCIDKKAYKKSVECVRPYVRYQCSATWCSFPVILRNLLNLAGYITRLMGASCRCCEAKKKKGEEKMNGLYLVYVLNAQWGEKKSSGGQPDVFRIFFSFPQLRSSDLLFVCFSINRDWKIFYQNRVIKACMTIDKTRKNTIVHVVYIFTILKI